MRVCSIWSRTTTVLSCVLILTVVATPVRGQLLTVRVVDGDGTPLGLTSVVLRPLAAESAVVVRRLTASDGVLRQVVPPGPVMVVARHVGFRADSVRVDGDSLGVPRTLRLTRIPQMLVTMLVRDARDCSVAGQAPAAGDGSLWDELVKGIESRRLLRDSYRYERRYRRVITRDPSIGATTSRVTDTVEVNEPSQRGSLTAYRDGSYTSKSGNTTNIRVFDESDLTQDGFLTFHCHGAPWRDTTDGSVRIAFGPRSGVRGGDDANRVRGTVIMDAATWRTRAVEYEYVRDGKAVGHGRVVYAPVTVDGSVVAMPMSMVGDLKVSGRFGLASMLASWTIDQTYGAFTRVGGAVP